MTNKIKSLVGALALAGSVAIGSNQVDSVSFSAPEFTSIPVLDTNNTQRVELRGTVYAGDTNHYNVQSTTNLLNGTWADSLTNTNIYSKTGRTSQFYVYEPFNSDKDFYRLKSNSSSAE
jgi:hypothetical protein